MTHPFTPLARRAGGPVLFLLALALGYSEPHTRPRGAGKVEDPNAVVTRAYDVRDFLAHIPALDEPPLWTLGTDPADHPAARGLFDAPAGGGANGSGRQPPTRDEEVANLLKMLLETIASDTWKATGGTIGAVKELSGQLVVTQTRDNHRQIADLLDQLRESRAIQVTIETRLIRFDEAGVREAGIKLDDLSLPGTAGPTASASAATVAPDRADVRGTFLDERQVDQLLRAAQSQEHSALVTAPRFTLFNGQRAYVMVATEHGYVSSYQAVARPSGETAFEPQTSVAQSGLILDATATASANRKYATLTLRPQLAAFEGMDEIPWPGRPEGSHLTVQRPRLRVTTLNTTVSVPDGGTMLFVLPDPGELFTGVASRAAGVVPDGDAKPGTGPASPPTTRPNAAGEEYQPRRLVMLVKPKIILAAPREQKQYPLLNSRKTDE